MNRPELLSIYVREALAAGQSAESIESALAQAGWTPAERAEALDTWIAAPAGLPPIPRPRPQRSAREALTSGLLFLSLGVVSFHLGQLGFVLIDALLPDPADGVFRPMPSGHWSMAALIGFTPVFLWLHRRLEHARPGGGTRPRGAAVAGRDFGGRSTVRRWLASATLLLATLVLLGDAVVTLYALLDGALTTRFAARAALVAVIAMLVLGYYRDELDDG